MTSTKASGEMWTRDWSNYPIIKPGSDSPLSPRVSGPRMSSRKRSRSYSPSSSYTYSDSSSGSRSYRDRRGSLSHRSSYRSNRRSYSRSRSRSPDRTSSVSRDRRYPERRLNHRCALMLTLRRCWRPHMYGCIACIPTRHHVCRTSF